ncbi:MAG: chitobiase/beta-hexosaminidase C-terminal domain-containing protein [Clostridiaceae bacterium]|nr:chitobiase/beta-hexosaminidase C-terminal domain-containing protein [Clostridiaceae bacterium]
MNINTKTVQITLFSILGLFLLFCCSKQAEAKPGDSYSADKAVAYADSCFKKSGNSYKANPSKKYGRELCAGYVSQCLKEGGMSMDSTWYWKGIGKTSNAWRLSKQLFSYLKKSGYKINYSPSDSDVEKGDVVFYWTNGGWGHVAICVGRNSAGKPLVNAYNDAHYHFSYWTMGYKTCVVSMESRTAAPEIKQTVTSAGTKVTLSCDTKNATIYYTTNGKTPTTSSQKYSSPFQLKKSATVKAIAVYSNYKNSSVTTKSIDSEKTLEEGVYFLRPSGSSGVTLGISNSAKTEDTPATLIKKNEEYNRKVSVSYLGNGKYSITLLHSDLALTESDSTVVQKKYTAAAAQQWTISLKGTDTYRITNVNSSAYLSIGSSFKAGLQACTSSDTEAVGKLWCFTPALKSTLQLTNGNSPKSLKKGSSFVLRGTVSSDLKIKFVQASILNENGKTVATATAKPNALSYSILKISGKIKFGELSRGTYTYRITAYDSARQLTTLLSKKFKVK